MYGQGESAEVAGFRYPEKRKRQIEVHRSWSAKFKMFKWNGTIVLPRDQISNGENHLPSTQRWRKALFNVSLPNNRLLALSEKFFRNNVNVFLYGIDKCAGNPAQWSSKDTNVFYRKISSFLSCWKKRLLKKNKHDWVTIDTNQLNLFSRVYQESLKFVTFSATQRKTIDSKFKEISDLKNAFPSIKAPLKIKDQQQIEAKKQADDNAEKRKSSFKALPTPNPPTHVDPQVMLDKCLQDKETQSKSAVVYPEKRQIEDNNPSSVGVKNFKWNGTTVYPSDKISNGENHLASTQMWRKLLFSNVSPENELLVKTKEIFEENINVFLYGIEKCAANPAQWSREDTNFFYNKIMSFVDSWKMQLLMETIAKINGKDFWLKGKLEKNCELVANRLNLLTSVYTESLKFMSFTKTQLNGMDIKFEELNDFKNKFSSMATVLQMKEQELTESRKRADEYLEELRKVPSKFNESSLAKELLKNQTHELNGARKQADEYLVELRKTQKSLTEAQLKLAESSLATELLKNKDHELNEARERANEYLEELRKTQKSLKEARLKLNESSLTTELLKNKDHELNEARKLANDFCEELKKTQIRLKEAHVKLNDLLPTNNPLPPVDPQDKNKQLNELKQQLDWGAKKQKETEAELKETREQLQSFVAKSREMTHTKQKDTIKKLSEIQTSLSMINPNYRPSCEIENESLNKEEKMFQDIKALLEYTMQSVRNDNNCKKNTTESALESNNSSASLRVSEYEMHLVTQIAAYLNVTPFPVSSHSIYSYVTNIDNVVDLQFVESLLRKFPSFFKEVAGAPGSMDKNWIYLDLKPVITI